MRTIIFSAKPFERPFLEHANNGGLHELHFEEAPLSASTAGLAAGYEAICAFANDRIDEAALQRLKDAGVRFIALRSAGFNQVDVAAAERLGLQIARVPAYSPESVAEHTIGLMLTLNRKFHRAYNRVREGNFALNGLIGFNMHGKTVGIIGTGRIGLAAARILRGFGCTLLAFDPIPSEEARALGVQYFPLDELLPPCDIITVHCPLTPDSFHLINDRTIAEMKPGVMLINTSRGAVADARALIRGLKGGHIGSLGLDVYEEEADLFFRDLSDTVIQDDVFMRLLTFPNVVITAHQAFFTREAVEAIARTTIDNLTGFEKGSIRPENLVTTRLLAP